LKQDNAQLKSQTEEMKTKTLQVEARLLESMQARSAREHKFQDEMKRQRASMNSLFTELADSKRQVQVLTKQLQETSSKLAVQQALTANIAFQQEQEELEYQMEQEQFLRKQQQQLGGNGETAEMISPQAATAAASDYEQQQQQQDDITRDSGFSRLGNYFNRRRVPNDNHSGGAMSTTASGTTISLTAGAPTGAPNMPSETSTTTTIGPLFQSYEESKNDLFEQLQYGSGNAGTAGAGDVRTLFDMDTTSTTATTTTMEDSSSSNYGGVLIPSNSTTTTTTTSISEDYLQKITPTTLPQQEQQVTSAFTTTTRKQQPLTKGKQQHEEMNYGQTSAGMPPAAPMSRLDRIRQKRRNLENMFRKNGAGSTVSSSSGRTANSSLSSSTRSSSNYNNRNQASQPSSSSIPPVVVRGTTNFRARNNNKGANGSSPNRNNNHNLSSSHHRNNVINLMNHRGYDDWVKRRETQQQRGTKERDCYNVRYRLGENNGNDIIWYIFWKGFIYM